jgi:hypothetical protein
MRMRATHFLGSTLFLALLAGSSLTARAGSTIVTIKFSGTLTAASNVPNGVAAGDTIAGTVVYNTAQSQTGTSGLYTFTGSSNTHAFSFQIYPPNTASQNQTEANLLFSDSYSGESTSPFQVHVSYNSSSGTSLTISGDTGATNTGTFALAFLDPKSAGGYSATNLPLPNTTVMQNFVTTQATLAYTDGFMATINSFQIYDTFSDSGPTDPPVFSISVPEPSSLVLVILGISTSAVGYSIARRKRRS